MAYRTHHGPITWDTPARTAALAGTWLQVKCVVCGRRGAVSPASLGPCGEVPLRGIGRRLKCLDCKRKGQVRLWILPQGH